MSSMTESERERLRNSGTSRVSDVEGKFPSERPDSGMVMHDIVKICLPI